MNRLAAQGNGGMIARMRLFFGGLFALILFTGFYLEQTRLLSALDYPNNGEKSVSERVQQYGNVVATRLQPSFAKAGVAYPPAGITLVVLKQERQLELYAQSAGSTYRFIRSYPIMAASGHLGPKLREGDWQVPEGIYGVDSLNPNSLYHVALHVDYPNAFDRAQAKADGRSHLGGEIMIHGNEVSIGCVAMGDIAAEDLFVLSAKAGIHNVKLLLCPFDFRLSKDDDMPPGKLPAWAPELYRQLRRELWAMPLPQPSNTPS